MKRIDDTLNAHSLKRAPWRPWRREAPSVWALQDPLVRALDKGIPFSRRTPFNLSGAGAPFFFLSGQVRASHLLIKHSGSRRPASWKDPDGREITKRSKEAATEKLRGLREAIASGQQEFADAARSKSDCSSASRGGDLGACSTVAWHLSCNL